MKGYINRAQFFRGSVLSCALAACFINVAAQQQPSVQTISPRRIVAADYTRVKGRHDKFFRRVVGAGRAAEGLRADWQRDLSVVRRECGFEYIRFHGLLEDEMGVYGEDKQGRPVYNFQYVDAGRDHFQRIAFCLCKFY